MWEASESSTGDQILLQSHTDITPSIQLSHYHCLDDLQGPMWKHESLNKGTSNFVHLERLPSFCRLESEHLGPERGPLSEIATDSDDNSKSNNLSTLLFFPVTWFGEDTILGVGD